MVVKNNKKKQLELEKQNIGSWGHLVKERINQVLNYAGKRILDVGCSNGAYVNFLRNKGYVAYGLDFLPDDKWEDDIFQVGDVCCLPYKNASFDTVIAFEILEHVGNINLALSELYRVCRKNIIISVPNCSQPKIFRASGLAYHHWIDRTHVQFFTEDILKDILNKNGFSIEILKYINPIIPEILFLSSWHIPVKLIRLIVRLLVKIRLREKYYMTLLIVASKNNERGFIK